MNTETSFNPADVEPAKVNFLQDQQDVNKEQLDQSTQVAGTDKPEIDTASQQAAPNAQQQVQATPQDSEVYKNLQAHFTKVSQDNSELRNEVMQLRRELTAAQQQRTTIPAPAAAQPNLEELDKTAEDFEELKPFVSTMKTMQGQINAQQATIKSQQEDYNNNTAANTEQERMSAITQVHADAIPLTNSVDFQGWLARQPSYMQSLMPNGPAAAIIDLVTAYKNSKGGKQTSPHQQPNQQQQQLDTARLASAPDINSPAPKLTTDSGKRIYSNDEIGAMSYKEYAALADDIELAMTEGRITV